MSIYRILTCWFLIGIKYYSFIAWVHLFKTVIIMSEQITGEIDRWMRLSLLMRIHGQSALINRLKKKYKITCPKKLHLWIAKAEAKARTERNREKAANGSKNKGNKNVFNVSPLILKHLLGKCHEKYHKETCSEETDITKLDITDLKAIFENIEHIIPVDVLSKSDILDKQYISIIVKERNDRSHYKPLTKDGFDKKWKEIVNVFSKIGYQNDGIKDLKTGTLDPFLYERVKLLEDSLKDIPTEESIRVIFKEEHSKLLLEQKAKIPKKEQFAGKYILIMYYITTVHVFYNQ